MSQHTDVNPASEKSRFDYRAARVVRTEHSESSFTRVIEQQTAKIPSDWFLFLAIGAMVGSLVAEARQNNRLSRFVGMWAPTLLTFGVYNKLVKVMGSG